MLKSYKNILLIILAVFVVFAAGIVLMPKKEQVIDNGKNKELQERQKELQIKFEQTKKEELRKKMQEENKPEEVLKEGEEKVNENILCDDESLKEASKKLKEIVLNKDEDSLDNNKIFKDFDNDGTFEIVGYWDTVYLFQNDEYIRVNNLRFSNMECQDNKPSSYWEENIYSLSPDNKKMAWIIPTITEIDHISIGLYFFKTDEIKTFYSGETNMYSILMKYLKWIDNENFMFIKKNCTEGGCGFRISKKKIKIIFWEHKYFYVSV